jgi:NADH-quinone oxidoreductase subunit M
MPIFSAFFLFFSFANIGLPGTSNFVGELLIFLGVGSWSPVAAICCSFGFILSVAYSIWLYNRICFGSLRTLYVISFKDIAPSDIAILIPLTLVTLLLGICPSLLLDTFSRSSTFLILKQVDLHFRLCNIGPL